MRNNPCFLGSSQKKHVEKVRNKTIEIKLEKFWCPFPLFQDVLNYTQIIYTSV